MVISVVCHVRGLVAWCFPATFFRVNRLWRGASNVARTEVAAAEARVGVEGEHRPPVPGAGLVVAEGRLMCTCVCCWWGLWVCEGGTRACQLNSGKGRRKRRGQRETHPNENPNKQTNKRGTSARTPVAVMLEVSSQKAPALFSPRLLLTRQPVSSRVEFCWLLWKKGGGLGGF